MEPTWEAKRHSTSVRVGHLLKADMQLPGILTGCAERG